MPVEDVCRLHATGDGARSQVDSTSETGGELEGSNPIDGGILMGQVTGKSALVNEQRSALVKGLTTQSICRRGGCERVG